MKAQMVEKVVFDKERRGKTKVVKMSDSVEKWFGATEMVV